MLNGLREKFSSLPSNDPDRVRVIITMPAMEHSKTEFDTTYRKIWRKRLQI